MQQTIDLITARPELMKLAASLAVIILENADNPEQFPMNPSDQFWSDFYALERGVKDATQEPLLPGITPELTADPMPGLYPSDVSIDEYGQYPFPCTIIPARYEEGPIGSYWYALPMTPDKVPAGAYADDWSHTEWFMEWTRSKRYMGMGRSPAEALEGLRSWAVQRPFPNTDRQIAVVSVKGAMGDESCDDDEYGWIAFQVREGDAFVGEAPIGTVAWLGAMRGLGRTLGKGFTPEQAAYDLIRQTVGPLKPKKGKR